MGDGRMDVVIDDVWRHRKEWNKAFDVRCNSDCDEAATRNRRSMRQRMSVLSQRYHRRAKLLNTHQTEWKRIRTTK